MKEMDFCQKIVWAYLAIEDGYPLKDVLDEEEIEQAISMLADILTITGVRAPEDDDDD